MSSSTATSSTSRALHAPTMAHALHLTAEEFPDVVAVRTLDDSVSLTWQELRGRVNALAGGLAKLGVQKGDTVALMLSNRPEFHIADLAAMTLGAVPFSLYQTLTAEQIEYILGDSGAKVAIIEQQYAERFEAARALGGKIETVITLDNEAAKLSFAEVERLDPEFDPSAAVSQLRADDLLTLIYTSGTTGQPKGVELTHRNLLIAVSGFEQFIEFEPGCRVISWLPAAHIAERAAHHYIPVLLGMTVTCCPNPKEILSYLPQVRPNWFFAVPRIWEKLKAGLEAMLATQPEEQRVKMTAALDAAVRRIEYQQAGETLPAELEEAVATAETELFSNLRAMLGLNELMGVHVGAAPTPREVLVFFHAIGVELAELWGMSETSAAGTVNPPHNIKIGTVGLPLPGVEVKVAEDGEVLVKSEVVMAGYRNMPTETAETIDSDGWLHTGDVGTIDGDGYLTIVDRKKEIIINSAGKNMSPSNIEATLKSSSPLIGQACVIGDGRPYNTALLVLDADFAPAWAAQQGIDGADLEKLSGNEKMRAAIDAGVETANSKLARVEQIKKFTLLRTDWLPGGDELTPTMKLKRKPICEKYKSEIEAMYS